MRIAGNRLDRIGTLPPKAVTNPQAQDQLVLHHRSAEVDVLRSPVQEPRAPVAIIEKGEGVQGWSLMSAG